MLPKYSGPKIIILTFTILDISNFITRGFVCPAALECIEMCHQAKVNDKFLEASNMKIKLSSLAKQRHLLSILSTV